MSSEGPSKPRCFLALPYGSQFEPVRDAVRKGVREAGFRAISLDEEPPRPIAIQQVLAGELARADSIVADLTGRNPNVFFELGLAQAMGKPFFLLFHKNGEQDVPFDLRGFRYFPYELSSSGLLELTKSLSRALREYRRSPLRARGFSGARLSTPFFVEWDRLDQTDAENLCRELLTQMGYQRVDWVKKVEEFDLIAELPKKDPDGFEYRELWLVAMGRKMPPEMVLDMVTTEPDFFVHRLLRVDERLKGLLSQGGMEAQVTILVILLKSDRAAEVLTPLQMERRMRRGRSPFSVRIRVWDRSYLTSLVQQFPQIGYKYFSDEARPRSRNRKTYEELYNENVELTNGKTALIAALEDEKNQRVRAERDAIWKDISFSAAHKIGNPLFAIETNLDPLQKRINESRREEATEVTTRIRASVEKAKSIVDQFKSLTRAQEIAPEPTPLRPILEDACKSAAAHEVSCEVDCRPEILILGDPNRLAECFDELVINATHWFDRPDKRVDVTVTEPAPHPLPESVDSSQKYALIHFKDNGAGVPLEDKGRIFDAFFTKRDQGTGLGLALVRRIIEGHRGAIAELGIPGKGADFEIYLPTPNSAGVQKTRKEKKVSSKKASATKKERRKKR